MQTLEKYDDILNMWIGEHCTVDALNVRLQAERQAIAFLQEHKGNFDHDELLQFCATWNAECFDKPGVPRVITCTRFGDEYDTLISAIEENSAQYRMCVQEVWNAVQGMPLNDVFGLYTKYMNYKGIELLFSMLLYLYSIQAKQKMMYYPWSLSMAYGVSYLFDAAKPDEYAEYIVGINKPLEKKIRISSQLTSADYSMYCQYCNEIRSHSNVYPQEVDFLLKMASSCSA